MDVSWMHVEWCSSHSEKQVHKVLFFKLYVDHSFGSLDLRRSLGITIDSRKLERGHCTRERKILMEGTVVNFNVNWPPRDPLHRDCHLKKCPIVLMNGRRPSQMWRERQGVITCLVLAWTFLLLQVDLHCLCCWVLHCYQNKYPGFHPGLRISDSPGSVQNFSSRLGLWKYPSLWPEQLWGWWPA